MKTLQEQESGFLIIDKPIGATSFAAVAQVKRCLNKKGIKVGHAGTLDPFASGLLIIAVGRQATRELSKIIVLDKRYVAKAKLGELRDTLDKTGSIIDVDAEFAATVTQEKLQDALHSFGASYTQKPPIFSALKYQGKPLYRHARMGTLPSEVLKDITEKKSREVRLFSLKLLAFSEPFFSFFAHVSHGTYIRSLADDIAQRLGGHATTYELRRTAIGPFDEKDAIELAKIVDRTSILGCLMPIASFVREIEGYTATL